MDSFTIFLAGDLMTGRGIDQIQPHPADPGLHESVVRDARAYVRMAERMNGPSPTRVPAFSFRTMAVGIWHLAFGIWQLTR